MLLDEQDKHIDPGPSFRHFAAQIQVRRYLIQRNFTLAAQWANQLVQQMHGTPDIIGASAALLPVRVALALDRVAEALAQLTPCIERSKPMDRVALIEALILRAKAYAVLGQPDRADAVCGAP